jgi:hypothetical protein
MFLAADVGWGDALKCLMTPALCAVEAGVKATGVAEVPGILQMLADFILDPTGGTIEAILQVMFSWLLIPSVDPEHSTVVSTIRDSWMAPIVAVFLTCGIIWQGFRMVLSRKGAPLITAVKGILATAIWGGIAAIAAAALLRTGDTFSCWIIGEALREPGLVEGGQCAPAGIIDTVVRSRVVDHFVHVLEFPTALLPGGKLLTTVLAMLMGLIIAISVLIQMFLFIIRGGSLLILVGVSQLAAAGTVTGATAGWLRRLIPWTLAMIFYKPVVAMVYATGLLLTDNGNEGLNTVIPTGADDSVRNFMFGVTMMLMAPFAMPALMKFFTWGFTALGRDGTMTSFATGMDNLGDDAIWIGNALKSGAGKQAKSIDSSLPAPTATGAPATAGSGTGAPAAASGSAAATSGTGAAASGAASGTGAATAAGGATVAAGAAAAPATMGVSLVVAGAIVGVSAAATQIGRSLKKGITDHMDEDNL